MRFAYDQIWRLYRAGHAGIDRTVRCRLEIAAEERAWTKIPSWLIAIVVMALAVLGGRAMSAQDKYTVQVPNGLAFSEFRGYEDWQVVAISQTEELIAVILANPVMIEAYRAGVPGNGTTLPRRLQDREGPLEAEKERGRPRRDDGAGRPA